MKKSLPGAKSLLPVLFVLLISCSKSSSPDTTPNVPETSISFKVNGFLYEWRNKVFCGLYCGASITKFSGYYSFISYGNSQNSNYIHFKIPVTNLTTSTYNITVSASVSINDALHFIHVGEATLYNEITAASTEPGDFFNITITSLHDGKYADGKFTSLLTQFPYGSSAPKAEITEGEFHNVIIYQ